MNKYMDRIKNDPETHLWKVKAREGRKVEAIKAFRDLTGAPLKEAKDVVEEYDARLRPALELTTTYVNLPNKGTLSIVTDSNGYSTIVFSQTVATHVNSMGLPQAIADAALRFNEDR